MSYIDRLQSSITLSSPDGSLFEAKWIGNDRTLEKKLGLFDYPDVGGTTTQDLNVTSVSYPLTIYFDGRDHDLEAERFFLACRESGNWEVDHPAKGTLTLQLVSVTEQVRPVENGHTVFELQFIEPSDVNIARAEKELHNRLLAAVEDANENIIQQFVDQVSGVVGNARTAVVQAVKKGRDAINSVVNPIKQLDNDISSAYDSINRNIDALIDEAILAPQEIAGAFVNLIQLPARVATDTREKINTFKKLISDLSAINDPEKSNISVSLDGFTKESFAVKDMMLSIANAGLAIVVSETDAVARTEIINQVDDVSSTFTSIVAQLDGDQSLVDAAYIDGQYFSQETTYPQNLYCTYTAIAYLLRVSADLSVEKKYTLTRDELPINICIREYGTDELLDFFYKTNNLYNDDLLLLGQGREVIIYPGVTA